MHVILSPLGIDNPQPEYVFYDPSLRFTELN